MKNILIFGNIFFTILGGAIANNFFEYKKKYGWS